MIPLGYEIGTGKRVSVPLNHMVVLGQTQLSGKTTTLEALVTRSGLRAIAFITKPGEKSFRLAPDHSQKAPLAGSLFASRIPAFFSESTIEEYWKYVVAIVENLMAVHLGWQERGWIVKLCQDYGRAKTKTLAGYKWKKPKTLRELLGNVEIALPHLRGTPEMICIQLREYLKPAVREIERTKFSDKLTLATGINVMDITELSDGLKTLVIRSVIEWVHKHGRKIIVIVPEAWKFIPEGRSNPVKLALEGLIREGAGVGNFVWMDSQDLRGVDKLLLRSVIVWLFGVQRQKNEVSNTLASIPDHPKPTATEIMQLGKGEFFVAHGTELVHTYVQPAGMEDEHAQAIARGEEEADSWRSISRNLDHADVSGTLPAGQAGESDGDDPEERAAAVPDADLQGEDDAMWKEKYETLKAEFDQLREAHDAMADRLRKLEGGTVFELPGLDRQHEISSTEPAFAASKGQSEETAEAAKVGSSLAHGRGSSRISASALQNGDLDGIYRYVVDRAAKELPPSLIRVLAERPELQIKRELKTIEANASTLRGALGILISEKFFDEPKNGKQAFQEVQRRGRRTAKPNVYRELDSLAELGFLTKEDTGYQAVSGMKVRIVEAK